MKQISVVSMAIRSPRAGKSARIAWPKLFVLVLLLCLVTRATPQAASPAAAQVSPALPAGVQKITSVEGITEYHLSNGLRVLLFPDPSKSTTTVNLTILVGSRQENYGEKGMAHLLEHMLFKGSTSHTNIPQEMSGHGALFNASTYFDRTNYFEVLQATDENLKWALGLEADRMMNSFIAKKDLDSEMTVVRNEFEIGENSPQRILTERLFSTAYLWHNYAHSTIGARSDIENVPIERLQAFYHNFYQPDNAVLMVAGKIDAAKTLGLIQETFGRIPAPTRHLQDIYTVEPVQDGERSVTLQRVGDVQVVIAGYHVPSGSHPDYAAVDILSHVLAEQPSGRLYKALVESKKATDVNADRFQLKDPSMLLFDVTVRRDLSLDAARDELLKTLDATASSTITKEEVERARQVILRNIELNLANSERVGLSISEWAAMGDWRLLFLFRDRIRQVTPEDVQRVAAAYLKPSNRTVGLFIPAGKPDRSQVPPAPDVAQMLKNYKGDAELAAGEAFDPSPENIESRVTRVTLPNGLKLALLPKKTRGATVAVSATFRFGSEKSLWNRSPEASLTGQMLMRGTTEHNRQQIKDEFDRLKARVGVFGGATQATVSAEAKRETLVPVLKLLTEVLREPSFPEAEFDQLKQEQLAQIESSKSQPQSVAMTTFRRHLHPFEKGDVRYVSTPDETIEEIKATTLPAVKKFYSDFYGASNGQLSIVGDFDEKEIQQLLTGQLGSWKSSTQYARVPDVYQDASPLAQSLPTPDKANAFLIGGMNLNMRDDDPDYAAVTLGGYIFGGGMNSRLFKRVRQKDGLSYAVGSNINASALDKSGGFTVFAMCAPQNGEKVDAAVREEITSFLKDGVDADEVKTAKSAWLQSRQLMREQDGGLAGLLANYLYLDRTLAWESDLEKKVSDLTPEQIVAAMRKHLDPSKISMIKAGDFTPPVAANGSK
jgi:zinc protease